MDHLKNEILILGAGPGGVVTALALAKKGIPCTLVEKEKFPRDKVCGDAISGKVVEVLRKIDPNIIEELSASPIQVGSWGVTFVAPNLKALKVPFKSSYNAEVDRAPGFISKRIDFDNFLLEQARKNPLITIVEQFDARKHEFTGNGWEVTSKTGQTISAKLIIAANGAHSTFVRKNTDLPVDQSHYCGGIRAYYKGVKGLDPDNFIELHFLKEFLPGYFWIFPLPDGRANIGVGMRSDKISKHKIHLKNEMLNIIKTHPSIRDRFEEAEPEGDIRGFGLPLGSKKRKISGDHYMLIGDAASLIDPFTGEGIGNAMMSGWLAAEQAATALSVNAFSAKDLEAYDRQVYKRLWNELLLSYRMQQMVNYPWLFNLVVNKANKNKTLQETISCMFEDLDLRKKLKNPAFYFKLLFN